MIQVAAIQHDIAWEDGPATYRMVTPAIAAAADRGARLVLLTEMFATGFSMAVETIAEKPDGPTTEFLLQRAQAAGAWVGGSIPTWWPDGTSRPRNVFTLAGPDGTVHRYAKLHPFSYAKEHEIYEPGDQRITVDIDGVRVTPFVCYDLRFANAFWDRAPGTDLYTVVANWPEVRREAWMALLRARAIENQAYVVGANRVGEGGGQTYSGDSAIYDPLGHPLATASKSEAILMAPVDPDHVAAVRARYPFLPDRRQLG
jgi:predicted amidohydrolase